MRRARLRKGISQGELARLLGITRMTVWRWETGLTEPRKSDIEKLKNILE